MNAAADNLKNIPEGIKNALCSRLPDRFYHACAFDGATHDIRRNLCDFICASLMCRAGGDFAKPCGCCPACTKVYNHEHPDIYFIDNSDGKASAEQVRAVCTETYVLPGEADNKIFIIDFADKLSVICQNALLKILEEPPENVYFILLCSNFSSMLQTVRSRVATFSLDNADDLCQHDYNEKTLAAAAGICDALCVADEIEIFESVKRIENLDSQQNAVLFEMLRVIIRNAAVSRSGSTDQMHILEKQEARLAQTLSDKQLSRLEQVFFELSRRCGFHANTSALIGTMSVLCADIVI